MLDRRSGDHSQSKLWRVWSGVASVRNVAGLPSKASDGELRAGEELRTMIVHFSSHPPGSLTGPLEGSLAKQGPSPGDISSTGKLPEFNPSRVGLKVTWKIPQISKYPLCRGRGSWELVSELDISAWTCFFSGFSPLSNSWAGGWRNGATASLSSLGPPCEAGMGPSNLVGS